MKVKSESEVGQSHPTRSDPMGCSLPGSSAHGIFQARVLEWGAIAFSNDKPRQHIKKQRHHFAEKGPSSLSNFTFTFHFHALEKEMATHSIILAWRIPGTGEPGGLPSLGSHRVGHD